jgi:hypothetical protein
VDTTPDRVERIDPPAAVVALLDREVDLTLGPDRTDTDVYAQQPFFATAEAASTWLADHPQGRLIPVRDFHAEARRLVARPVGVVVAHHRVCLGLDQTGSEGHFARTSGRPVRRLRRGHVDHIDGGILGQRLPAAVRPQDCVYGGKRGAYSAL